MSGARPVIDDMMSVKATAAKLGVSLPTLRRWIYRGEIAPVYRPGGKKILIPVGSVARFLEAWKI